MATLDELESALTDLARNFRNTENIVQRLRDAAASLDNWFLKAIFDSRTIHPQVQAIQTVDAGVIDVAAFSEADKLAASVGEWVKSIDRVQALYEQLSEGDRKEACKTFPSLQSNQIFRDRLGM